MSRHVEVTTAATFCATLVDEWVRAGVTHAFVAPGSRSTPLALALADRDAITVIICHDERVASFAALGRARSTGVVAVALCSSGTAGAHFLAAVAEADLSSIPLLVVTADRPPWMWSVGAPQVMDQTGLFGDKVRFFSEPGVPHDDTSSTWRSVAARVVAEAHGWSGRPGPVHLNLSFADPLTGRPGPLPPGRAQGDPWHRSTPASLVDAASLERIFVRMTRAQSGVVVAGEGPASGDDIVFLAQALGWPLLADHQSGARSPDTVTHYDALLRDAHFARVVRPEVILRLGTVSSSKSLAAWIAACASEGTEVLVATDGKWSDPDRVATEMIGGTGVVAGLVQRLRDEPPKVSASVRVLRDMIVEADQRARAVVAAALDSALNYGRAGANAEAEELAVCEPAIAAATYGAVPKGGALVAASSMAIRNLEWFVPGRPLADHVTVIANRGVNGIDGVIATGIGAATDRSTIVLIGDVAFVHDSSALVGLSRRALDLTIVVVDNDGGAIFGFLPQHDHLAPDTFEATFGTPHGTDLAALARSHGLDAVDFATWAQDPDRWRGHPTVVVAKTDRDALLSDHAEINAAVAKTLVGGAAPTKAPGS